MAQPPAPAPRSSPLALTVLALLHYQPLHPYGIQRLIKQWGKDQVVNVEQRTSLYRTIERLLAAGLIAVRETGRDPRYPERTVYEVTDAGRQTARRWLEEMLAEPRQEYPEFPAALSHVLMLEPAELIEVLERRAQRLTATLATLDANTAAEAGHGLPRIAMLENEYQRAVLAAEAAVGDADPRRAALGGADLVPGGAPGLRREAVSPAMGPEPPGWPPAGIGCPGAVLRPVPPRLPALRRPSRRRPGAGHLLLRIPPAGPVRPAAGPDIPARHRGPAAGPVALSRAAAGPRGRPGGEPRRGDDAADRPAAAWPGARRAEPADEGRGPDPDRHVQGARRRGGRLPGRRARGLPRSPCRPTATPGRPGRCTRPGPGCGA